ncbi:MAG: radical SAM protein [Desulfobacterales bacterium]
MRFRNFWSYRKLLINKGFIGALGRARQNIVADSADRPPVAGPYLAELDITYRCNNRCIMCQRWNDPRTHELTLAEYEALAKDFGTLGVQQMSIAGGEPLLRKDVFEIIQGFARCNISVNICTNGTMVHKYADDICASGARCISISLDGATAARHDGIRGMQGAHEVIAKGIAELMARPPEKRPVVRVRMTISNRNLDQVRAFYRRWQDKVDDILLQPVHNCQDALYTGLTPETFAIDPDRLLNQIQNTPFAHDGYLNQLCRSLKQSGMFPNHRCFAGVLMVRVDPWGNVYPCLEQHVCVGSIRKNDFLTLWSSAPFNAERRRLNHHKTCTCWYNNTAVISHYAHLLDMTRPSALFSRLRAARSQRQELPSGSCQIQSKR